MVGDRSSICGRASESNSPPERYLPDLVIAVGGEERRRKVVLVLRLILAGDANFDTFPLWKWQEFWTAVGYRSIILPREEEAASHSEER